MVEKQTVVVSQTLTSMHALVRLLRIPTPYMTLRHKLLTLCDTALGIQDKE